jgi:hypothetical protein
MSPRTLKTKFPCKTCGAEAEVGRLSEGPHATCDRCAERHRAFARVGSFDWSLDHAVKRARAAADEGRELDALEGWLDAASKSLESSRACVKALDVTTSTERRLYLRAARSRARWAANVAQQLESFFASLIDEASHGFTLLNGEAMPSERVGKLVEIRILTRE